MGSGNAKYVDPIKVPRTQGKCPPAAPPKWLLPDVCPMIKPPSLADPETRSIDWEELDRVLEAEIEDGIDNVPENFARPPSVAMSRINSGLKRNRQQQLKKVGHRSSLSFQVIDKHAKLATPQIGSTFEGLLSYLKQPIDDNLFPQTCLVRGLTIWFAGQDVKKTKYKPADMDTPAGIIQNVRNTVVSYTEAYTLICRQADISTVIVPGVVKAGQYEPGDIVDNGANDTWCTVHVDGSWQIIHPLWVCRGTYGPEKDGLVQIENDSFLAEKAANVLKENKKALVINDEFFMPRPDVFIYKGYAKDTQWHLIPNEKTIKSMEEFSMLAYIFPPFCKFGLSLLSEPYCVQRAVNGVVYIEILAPKEYAHRFNLGYQIEAEPEDQQDDVQLSQQHQQQNQFQNKLLQKKVLSRMVINYRSNDRFVFEIRLPLPGSYKFVVTGGFGTDICNLCRFKLVSFDNVGEWFVAPVEPGKDCWGPGPIAEKVGLLLTSKPSGFLAIPPKADSGVLRHKSVYHHLATVTFHINRTLYKKFEFTCEILPSTFLDERNIHSHFLPNGELIATESEKPRSVKKQMHDNDPQDEDFPVRAQYSVDHANRQLIIQVIGRLDGGECALVIKATEMEIKNNLRMPKKNSTKPVCYYFLSGNTAFYREPTQVRLVKSSLQDAMQGEDISKIQGAVDKCLKLKVHRTNDEIAAAEAKLEYLQLRKEMLDCVKRRNVAIVTETLKKVVGYKYRDALVVEVEKLLAFRSELQGLQGYAKGLPSVREANEELYKLAKPTPPVHNTMKALCVMLGYNGDIKDWKYIQAKLKVTPDKLTEWTVLKRMEYMERRDFPWHNMDVDVLDKTNAIVHKYPYEQVNHVSQAAAAIYKWIDEMLARAKDYLRKRLTN